MFPVALTPTVKPLDKFLLFSEKVVGPGSLTNFGILPGQNWAGAAGPRPVEVFLPLIQEAPGAQARGGGWGWDAHPAHKMDAGATWWLPAMAKLCLLAWIWRGGSLPLQKPVWPDGDGQTWAPRIPERPDLLSAETPRHPATFLV